MITLNNGKIIDTEGRLNLERIPQSEIDAVVSINTKMENLLKEAHGDFMAPIKKSVTSYFKNSPSKQELVIDTISKMAWGFANLYVHIVDEYNAIFCINDKDKYSQRFLSDIKKEGARGVDIQDIIEYAMAVQKIAFDCKTLVELV